MIHALLLGLALVPNGTLTYLDLKVGTGVAAAKGDCVEFEVRETLTDGRKFLDHFGQWPWETVVGQMKNMKYFDAALVGMKAGGERRVTVPPEMAYGKEGMAPNGADFEVTVPPNATVFGFVKLIAVYKASEKPALHIVEIKGGQGKPVKRGDTVHVYYSEMFLNGYELDGSYMRRSLRAVETPAGWVRADGPPLAMVLTVGKCQITPALDKALLGMKVGGMRKVIIPPPLYKGIKLQLAPYRSLANVKGKEGPTLTYTLEVRKIE